MCLTVTSFDPAPDRDELDDVVSAGIADADVSSGPFFDLSSAFVTCSELPLSAQLSKNKNRIVAVVVRNSAMLMVVSGSEVVSK